jgi:hypothetical protein
MTTKQPDCLTIVTCILGSSFAGYANSVRVKDGGTVTQNADFDDFSATTADAP